MSEEQQILIVDDDEMVLDVTSALLESEGYDVITANGGPEGAALAEEKKPALVISDVVMPEMDGFAVLKHVKEKCPETEVIMLTGNGTIDGTIQAMKNGAFDFILKPVEEKILYVTVEKALQHHAIQQDLERAKTQITRMDQLSALGELAAGIAHEIFQPLQAISNYNQLIKNRLKELGIEDEELAEHYGAIKHALGRQKEIIKGIKDFARVDKGESNAMGNASLTKAIENGLIMLKAQIQNHDIELVLELDQDIPEVPANLRQLEQISINMMVNAIDAIDMWGDEKGDEFITVRTFVSGDWVVGQWENTGPKIPDDILPSIFNPFYTTKEVGKGTGLGLSICHGIASDHHGELTVESDVERTVFTLKLPLNPPSDSE